MICINLLPWRESRLKKIKQIVICQLVCGIVFACLAVAAYRFVEQEKLARKHQSVSAFRQANQQVLKKIENLDLGSYDSKNLSARRQHLIHVINQRNKLPDILALLTAHKREGQFIRLFVDHRTLKITYIGPGVDDTLALFQLLNSYPAFCDVSFAPASVSGLIPGQKADYKSQVDHQDPSKQQDPAHKFLLRGNMNYEFNASLCDISAS